jgi:hypothetical protein
MIYLPSGNDLFAGSNDLFGKLEWFIWQARMIYLQVVMIYLAGSNDLFAWW